MQPGTIIHTYISKKGNTIIFRSPTIEDLAAVHRFGNEISQEDTFVMLSGETLSHDDQQKWLSDVIEKNTKKEKIHLAVLVNDTYAGNAEIRVGNRRKKHIGEVGISLAKPFREEGIGTELLLALEALAREYGLRLLTLTCFVINARALHVYEKLGYRRIGVLPGAYAYKGGFADEVILYKKLADD